MKSIPKRRRSRYRLRTLLVFVTFAGAGFGWLGVKLQAKEKEREAVKEAGDALEEKVLFEEDFTEKPGKGWSWLKESPTDWKIDKEEGSLLVRPTGLGSNMTNLLFRQAPHSEKGSLAFEVRVSHVPVEEYEISGLIYRFDDKTFVAITREEVGGGKMSLFLVQRKAGKAKVAKNVVYDKPEIDLRMVVSGSKVKGWYRAPGGDKWLSLGEMDMPSSGPATIGLRTGNGERNKSGWVRFSKFRILQIDD